MTKKLRNFHWRALSMKNHKTLRNWIFRNQRFWNYKWRQCPCLLNRKHNLHTGIQSPAINIQYRRQENLLKTKNIFSDPFRTIDPAYRNPPNCWLIKDWTPNTHFLRLWKSRKINYQIWRIHLCAKRKFGSRGGLRQSGYYSREDGSE